MWEQLALQEAVTRIWRWQSSPAPDSLLRGAPTCWSRVLATHQDQRTDLLGKVGRVPELFLTAREDRLFVEARKRVQTQNES